MPAPESAQLARLRSGGWLDGRRPIAFGGFLLAAEILVFLFLVAGTHGWIVPLDKPTSTDFASFYAAGSLADTGTPALAYDQPTHYAAEQQATEPGIPYQFFFYPPVFIMLCAALAKMPYMVAYFVFEGITLALYLLVARGIIGDKRWRILLPLLAFPSIFWTLGLGQNAFLTAAIFGAATLLVDRRPGWSGLLFGVLIYKPHFGLLIPVALAAGRRWRAFAGATLSAAALMLLSLALFGTETWRRFLAAALGSQSTYESGRIDFAGMVSPFGGLRLLGVVPSAAYAIQLAATLAAAVLVAIVWRRDLSLPVRAATLAAATLAAVPVALIYDLMFAAIAGAWLVRAGREGGFLPWEKTLLPGLFIVPLMSRNIGQAWGVPLAPLAVLLLLALSLRRAQSEIAGQSRLVPGLA